MCSGSCQLQLGGGGGGGGENFLTGSLKFPCYSPVKFSPKIVSWLVIIFYSASQLAEIICRFWGGYPGMLLEALRHPSPVRQYKENTCSVCYRVFHHRMLNIMERKATCRPRIESENA